MIGIGRRLARAGGPGLHPEFGAGEEDLDAVVRGVGEDLEGIVPWFRMAGIDGQAEVLHVVLAVALEGRAAGR